MIKKYRNRDKKIGKFVKSLLSIQPKIGICLQKDFERSSVIGGVYKVYWFDRKMIISYHESNFELLPTFLRNKKNKNA